MPDIQPLISQALTDVVQLLIVVALGFAVSWLRAHLGAKRLALAANIAAKAVYAVEQVAPGLKVKGAAKLTRALGEARRLAAAHGLALTNEQWTTLIEDAVATMKAAWHEIKSDPRTTATFGTIMTAPLGDSGDAATGAMKVTVTPPPTPAPSGVNATVTISDETGDVAEPTT